MRILSQVTYRTGYIEAPTQAEALQQLADFAKDVPDLSIESINISNYLDEDEYVHVVMFTTTELPD